MSERISKNKWTSEQRANGPCSRAEDKKKEGPDNFENQKEKEETHVKLMEEPRLG